MRQDLPSCLTEPADPFLHRQPDRLGDGHLRRVGHFPADRCSPDRPALRQRSQHFLYEESVALGPAIDRAPQLGRRALAKVMGQELLSMLFGERCQPQLGREPGPVQLGPLPHQCGLFLELLLSVGPENQGTGLAKTTGDVRQQRNPRCPLKVVEEEH